MVRDHLHEAASDPDFWATLGATAIGVTLIHIASVFSAPVLAAAGFVFVFVAHVSVLYEPLPDADGIDMRMLLLATVVTSMMWAAVTIVVVVLLVILGTVAALV